MNILETIIAKKRLEVESSKILQPLKALEKSQYYNRTCISISKALQEPGATGIIAEHKRKSPSKGVINDQLNVNDVVFAYQQAGASAISILTDQAFFGGSNDDILTVRNSISIPILRKEFIVDEYQIHEAKSIGADLILLIASCLNPLEVKTYAKLANQLGMEVLLELHDEDEFSHICNEVQLVGINNRSLKTFSVNIERSLEMAAKLPSQKIKVAESGINHASEVKIFREHGYKGFLIGENFMKSSHPGDSL
ncbi:MAG: indole-3-glycerol phosphate synthase TrpC, partial [Chitinophagia bacterium]|nr:indole-3-glycerol phosphate synthase TrpC [Chitinophagia bacterium]